MINAINKNIHDLRIKNGLTLQELAKRIGTSKQTIQRYETGEIANIPYDKILKIAKALNVSPQALMGWESPENEMSEGNQINNIYSDLPPDAKERLLAYAIKLKELSDMEE